MLSEIRELTIYPEAGQIAVEYSLGGVLLGIYGVTIQRPVFRKPLVLHFSNRAQPFLNEVMNELFVLFLESDKIKNKTSRR